MIKDEDVYEKMLNYSRFNSQGVSRETQLRALKLLKVVIQREIFDFSCTTMKDRWEKLSKALLMSNRFTIQENSPQYCTFYGKVRRPSPGNFSFSSKIKFVKQPTCLKDQARTCIRFGFNINIMMLFDILPSRLVPYLPVALNGGAKI